MFVLTVAGGPDKGRVYELTGNDPVVIGRGGNLVRLSDRKASREHCRLERSGANWTLSDNSSKHGTYHNHRRLSDPTPIACGDTIQIGRTVLVVSVVDSNARERSELLGPSIAELNLQPQGSPAWAKLAAAAAVLGVVGLIGFEVYDHQRQRLQDAAFAAMLNEMRDSGQQIADSADRMAAAWSPDELTGLRDRLDRVLAGVDAASDRDAALARIETALADQPQTLAPLFASLTDRLEQVDAARQRLDALAASLDNAATTLSPAAEAIDTIRAQAEASHRTLSELAVELGTTDAARSERLDTLLARLENQPDADALAERIAAATRQSVIDELRDLPSQETLAAEMRTAATEVGRAQARVLGEALNRLTLPQDLADQLAALQQQVADQPTRLEAALDQLAQAGVDADLDRLFAEVAAVKAALDTDMADRLDRVVAALDAKPTLDTPAAPNASAATPTHLADADLAEITTRLDALQADLAAMPSAAALADELRAVLAAAPAADPAVLAALADRLQTLPDAQAFAADITAVADRLTRIERSIEATTQLSARLAAIDARLDTLQALPGDDLAALLPRIEALLTTAAQAQPGTADDAPFVAELEALASARQASEARLIARLDALDTTLDAISDTTSADATSTQDLATQQAQAGDALRDVLDEVRRRTGLTDVQRQLTDLALLTASNRERLEQISVKIDGDRIVDEQLAGLAGRLQEWPAQANRQLDEVLARLDRQPAANGEELEQAMTLALKRELAALRNWLPDRQTLKHEVRTAVASANPIVVPTTRENVANASPRAATGRVRLNTTPAAPLAPVVEDGRPLTPTELAYRTAFETNMPTYVGAGEIDPVTGHVSRGRKIDPEAARAAGFESWREWHATDMFAEAMRQQRNNTRHLDANRPQPVRLPGQ
ncbi:MAG: FHA domain-containing protein [Planctomycetota bacterium]